MNKENIVLIAPLLDIISSLLNIRNAGIPIVFTIINIIIVIGLSVVYIYSNNKKNIIRKKVAKLNKNATLCDKNLYYSMKNSYKNDVDISTFNELVMMSLKEYVTTIAEILSTYTNERITVTIRFFEEKVKNINESKLKILTYSKNCSDKREDLFLQNKEGNLKVVKDNTDFKLIIGDRKSQIEYFYQTDLEEYDKRLRQDGGYLRGYLNTTPNWEDYYKSRIVVPIRMENNKLFFKEEDEGEDIIAFLCADAEKAGTFPDKDDERRFYISLLETYANRLYIILNKYTYYLTKRKEGKVHENKKYIKCV